MIQYSRALVIDRGGAAYWIPAFAGMTNRCGGPADAPHPAAKNALSAFAVAAGFSSVRKWPESTGTPETLVAQLFQVSSGVAAAVAMPASPHSASIGIVIFLSCVRSALSLS